MNCTDLKYYFDEYLAGRLSDKDKVRLENHLEDCQSCRKNLELEKNWLKIMQADHVPDPGEKYWGALENRIMAETIDKVKRTGPVGAPADIGPKRSLSRYLLPLAASFLLFIVSITGPDFLTNKESITIAAVDNIEGDLSEFTEKLCLNISKKPDILGTIMMSPPGSIGRHITIGRFNKL